MKWRSIMILGVFIILCATTSAQAPARNEIPARSDTTFLHGSKIAAIPESKQTIDNLYALCQLWSFLKYHHPAVTGGKYNWDAELMRVLPKVIDAPDKKALAVVFQQWYDGLLMLEGRKSNWPLNDNVVKLRPDYGDLFLPGFLDDILARKLAYLKDSLAGEYNQFYVGLQSRISNPEITNELAYTEMKFPDAGFRLLALYRYWGLVQYFFPNRHLIGEPWTNVLKEMLPLFLRASNAEDYSLACLQLIARVNDTHANIWGYNMALDAYRGQYFAPLTAVFIEGKLVVSRIDTADKQLLRQISKGDVITHISGKAVEDLVKELLPIVPGSNYTTQLRDIRHLLLRGKSKGLSISVLHEGNFTNVDVICRTDRDMSYPDIDNTQVSFKLITANIGYVFPGTYQNSDLPAIQQLFRDTKGIIVDMRCYPKEFMPFTFGNYIKCSSTPFVTFTLGHPDHPGLFTFGSTLKNGGAEAGCYMGKVIVIVNEETQSQAEYTTMAFQSSPNVTVIGSQTAGADGNISGFFLPGGIYTAFSGIGVLYPDKAETQRAGVRIDKLVHPTISGFRAGRDELLEKAIELINER